MVRILVQVRTKHFDPDPYQIETHDQDPDLYRISKWKAGSGTISEGSGSGTLITSTERKCQVFHLTTTLLQIFLRLLRASLKNKFLTSFHFKVWPLPCLTYLHGAAQVAWTWKFSFDVSILASSFDKASCERNVAVNFLALKRFFSFLRFFDLDFSCLKLLFFFACFTSLASIVPLPPPRLEVVLIWFGTVFVNIFYISGG